MLCAKARPPFGAFSRSSMTFLAVLLEKHPSGGDGIRVVLERILLCAGFRGSLSNLIVGSVAFGRQGRAFVAGITAIGLERRKKLGCARQGGYS